MSDLAWSLLRDYANQFAQHWGNDLHLIWLQAPQANHPRFSEIPPERPQRPILHRQSLDLIHPSLMLIYLGSPSPYNAFRDMARTVSEQLRLAAPGIGNYMANAIAKWGVRAERELLPYLWELYLHDRIERPTFRTHSPGLTARWRWDDRYPSDAIVPYYPEDIEKLPPSDAEQARLHSQAVNFTVTKMDLFTLSGLVLHQALDLSGEATGPTDRTGEATQGRGPSPSPVAVAGPTETARESRRGIGPEPANPNIDAEHLSITMSIKDAARLLEMNAETLSLQIASGATAAKQLSAQRYKFDLRDFPTWNRDEIDPEKLREAAQAETEKNPPKPAASPTKRGTRKPGGKKPEGPKGTRKRKK